MYEGNHFNIIMIEVYFSCYIRDAQLVALQISSNHNWKKNHKFRQFTAESALFFSLTPALTINCFNKNCSKIDSFKDE